MLRETFEIFDTNNDGLITVSEIQEVLESLGYSYSNEEVEEMVNEVDLDGDGAIDFKEFEQLIEQADEPEELETEEELRQAGCFAKGHSLMLCIGLITVSEIQEVLESLGYSYSNEEVEEMVNEVDLDGDELGKFNIIIALSKEI